MTATGIKPSLLLDPILHPIVTESRGELRITDAELVELSTSRAILLEAMTGLLPKGVEVTVRRDPACRETIITWEHYEVAE